MVATLAYRAAKVLRDPPPGFDTVSAGGGGRNAVLILAHLADLMAWGVTIAKGDYLWTAAGSDTWAVEVDRFFAGLAALDLALESATLADDSIEKLIQGPIADALTHVGQLSLLRGIAGAPVRPESYARAAIVIGRVGREQAPARKEFDGDASASRR
jgi:hypothetical protein